MFYKELALQDFPFSDDGKRECLCGIGVNDKVVIRIFDLLALCDDRSRPLLRGLKISKLYDGILADHSLSFLDIDGISFMRDCLSTSGKITEEFYNIFTNLYHSMITLQDEYDTKVLPVKKLIDENYNEYRGLLFGTVQWSEEELKYVISQSVLFSYLPSLQEAGIIPRTDSNNIFYDQVEFERFSDFVFSGIEARAYKLVLCTFKHLNSYVKKGTVSEVINGSEQVLGEGSRLNLPEPSLYKFSVKQVVDYTGLTEEFVKSFSIKSFSGESKLNFCCLDLLFKECINLEISDSRLLKVHELISVLGKLPKVPYPFDLLYTFGQVRDYLGAGTEFLPCASFNLKYNTAALISVRDYFNNNGTRGYSLDSVELVQDLINNLALVKGFSVEATNYIDEDFFSKMGFKSSIFDGKESSGISPIVGKVVEGMYNSDIIYGTSTGSSSAEYGGIFVSRQQQSVKGSLVSPNDLRDKLLSSLEYNLDIFCDKLNTLVHTFVLPLREFSICYVDFLKVRGIFEGAFDERYLETCIQIVNIVYPEYNLVFRDGNLIIFSGV